MSKIVFLFLVMLMVPNALFALQYKAPQAKPQAKPLTPEELRKLDKGKARPPHGSAFQIDAVPMSKGMYAALITDDQGRLIQEFFTHDKLPNLEAIVAEAKKFGATEEAVGGAKPMTTRFADKQVSNFLVDVAKFGKQTTFYITVTSQTGKLTIEAGSFKRGDPDAKPMLWDLLTHLQTLRAQLAADQ
ncbi:MAG: hypothetical protein HY231_09390 [Acidobacteria bacterium]|nr:hypothetical protein [Acidobacteriota bacterium]